MAERMLALTLWRPWDTAILHERQRARRALGEAGIAYGLACKRYLGGREG